MWHYTVNGYQDNFKIKDWSYLRYGGFSDLLNDDLETINSVKLDILKSQITCVEGGKCKITLSDGTEGMDSEDELVVFRWWIWIKQTGNWYQIN